MWQGGEHAGEKAKNGHMQNSNLLFENPGGVEIQDAVFFVEKSC